MIRSNFKHINIRRIFLLILGIVISMGIIHMLFYLSTKSSMDSDDIVHRLFHKVSMAGEPNLPAWFNASLWFLLGIVSLLVSVLLKIDPNHSQKTRNFRKGGGILTLVAFYASLDETTYIHENFHLVIDWLFGRFSNFDLDFSWTLPGAILAAFVGFMLLGFLGLFTRPVQYGLMLGGGVFLLGALGMETIGLTWYSHFGTDTNYQLFVIVEESLEMLGIAIALCALIYSVGYKVEEDGSLSLRLFLKEGDNK